MTNATTQPDHRATAEPTFAANQRAVSWRELRGLKRSLRAVLRPQVTATVAAAFGAFALLTVQGIVLARMLGPERRGEYGTAVFYTQALMYVGLLGTLFSVTRSAAQNPLGRADLSRSTVRLGGLTGLGTLVVVALLSMVALPAEKAKLAPLCILCGLALPFEHVRLLLLAVDRGNGQFGKYNVNQIATTAVFPVVLLILWSTGVVSVWVVALLTLAGPVLGLALRMVSHQAGSLLRGTCTPPASTLLREGQPYFLSVMTSDLFGRLDALLFLWLASFTAQGYYAAAVAAANLLLVAPNALAMFTFNVGARRESTVGANRALWAGMGLLIVQALAAAVFALVLSPLIRLVYGNAFLGAVPLTLALLPAFALNGFTQMTEGYLRGRGKISPGVWARGAGAVVMVTFTLLLYDRFQELTIPVAASVAHLLVAVAIGWIALRDIRDRQGDVNVPPTVGGMP